MSKDDDPEAQKAMQLAQKALEYEEAIYFYAEASHRILSLIARKKILPILKRNATEYLERAEYLKRELPRLQADIIAKRSPQQLQFESAEFTALKAIDMEERGEIDQAADCYEKSVELCLNLMKLPNIDPQLRQKLRGLAAQALERAEYLKLKIETRNKAEETEAMQLSALLPSVPTGDLSLSDLHLDDRAPAARGNAATGSPQIHPRNQHEGLTKEELAVLAATSRINGRRYVPFLEQDLKEQFNFSLPFSDKHGKLALTEKQVKRLKDWARPSDFFSEPTLIKKIDNRHFRLFFRGFTCHCCAV
ncbi:unnamed protein product, partial [Mesorhabditis spiculigera]